MPRAHAILEATKNQSRTFNYVTMSRDFHVFAVNGIAVNRIDELWAAEQRCIEVSAALPRASARTSFRVMPGALLFTAGRSLAGTTLAPSAPPAASAAGTEVAM